MGVWLRDFLVFGLVDVLVGSSLGREVRIGIVDCLPVVCSSTVGKDGLLS